MTKFHKTKMKRNQVLVNRLTVIGYQYVINQSGLFADISIFEGELQIGYSMESNTFTSNTEVSSAVCSCGHSLGLTVYNPTDTRL